MTKQVYNPYLPLYEYVPDGEPHVFGDRVYIYGSHDYAGGQLYCMGHYVAWSAPVTDLKDWRYEGIIYRRDQDPTNQDDSKQLWAPDVVQGPDGNYYLYYCFSFEPEIGVAKSASPAGPFEYLGHVKYSPELMGGKELNEHLPFDPAIFVDEDNRVYLYYGFSPIWPMPGREELEAMGLAPEQLEAELAKMSRLGSSPGAMVVELEQDMLTMKGEPRMMIPGGLIEEGTEFEGHGFFEASSMRKLGGKYYFVYSSKLSHELCYAISEYPDRDFTYGGTIVSNGDVGYKGNTAPKYVTGNNHGGLIEADGQYYIFYHRQTHATESSRQGCAEPVEILADGSIPQVEITSCGLNGGPLQGTGTYPAAIACYLTSPKLGKKVVYGEDLKVEQPYIYEEHCGDTEQEHIHYIANIQDDTRVGYKYFNFENTQSLTVSLRGCAQGTLEITVDEAGSQVAGILDVQLDSKEEWKRLSGPMEIPQGVHGLFLHYKGTGALAFKDFTLD